MNARPNILIVMYDQLTPSALGCYGNPVTHAPTIDRLARQGVVFDAAYSNSPLCTPARYCMMTGLLPSATRGYDNAAYLASTIPTFAHYARLGGYRTVLDGKMHFVGPDQLHGFEERRTTDIYPADFGWTPDWLNPDERIDWWFHNMDSVTKAGVAEVTNQLLFDDEVGHQGVRALHDLARADDPRPWMLVRQLHPPPRPVRHPRPLLGPLRRPRHPAAGGRARTTCRSTRTPRGCGRSARWTRCRSGREDVRNARRAYYGNISYLDEWTARLTDTLDALGVADDTVVVLLADHGDMLGERGLWYKMNFFEGSARVPMIVHAPKRFGPRRVAAPVSLVDVLPTVTELVGAAAPEHLEPSAGRSLLDLCAGGPSAEREVVGEYLGEGAIAPIVMIRRGDLKYVHSPVDPDQLYDLAADPQERVNLAPDPDWSVPVKELRARVERDWDMDALYADVVADQARRRLVNAALRTGTVTPWEYTPPQRRRRPVHAQPPRPQRRRAGEPLSPLGARS